jgi:mannan endo-1,4-beta-mannosidase
VHRILAALALALSATLALAGSYCVIDPPRPGASTGFYVAKPSTSLSTPSADTSYRLFDPAGNAFLIHGVNRNHWDSYGTPTGLPLSGANTERIMLNFANSTTSNWGIVSSQMLANGIVPIPGNWSATCKTDAASLSAIVDTWVAQASTWTQLNGTGLINIANEWGPAMSAADKAISWRDNYITAVGRMRAAGYTGALVIDAGSCGQDAGTIVKYGSQVLDADPLHNILFSVHIYGSWHYPATATWMQDYATAMAQLKATGLPILVGEFGPAPYTTSDGVVHTVGPSPTYVPTAQLIADVEANGWGWLPWSWDDNNMSGCLSSDVGGFSMTIKCGAYTGNDATELTAWGRMLVPMLKARR